MAKKNTVTRTAPRTPAIDHSDKTPEEIARQDAERSGKPATVTTPGTTATTAATGPKPLTEWDKQARELGPIHMKGVLLSRMAARVEATLKSIAKYKFEPPTTPVEGVASSDPFPGARTELVVAGAKLRVAADLITSVPRAWRPSVRGAVAAASAAVKVGSKVEIRDNLRKGYDGMLDAADLVNLEVIAMANGQVKVKTAKGEILFFKRGHVVPAATAAAAAE